MVERNAVPREEVEKMLVSPRDNQPYIIRWGMRTYAPGGEPPIIMMEQTGADGTRYVANARPEILQLSDEEFKQRVPDQGSTN
jgi:hypothetical protein